MQKLIDFKDYTNVEILFKDPNKLQIFDTDVKENEDSGK